MYHAFPVVHPPLGRVAIRHHFFLFLACYLCVPSLHLEVEPLAVSVGVEVRPQVQLVVGLRDADGLGQVARLEAGLEPEGVRQDGLEGQGRGGEGRGEGGRENAQIWRWKNAQSVHF